MSCLVHLLQVHDDVVESGVGRVRDVDAPVAAPHAVVEGKADGGRLQPVAAPIGVHLAGGGREREKELR